MERTLEIPDYGEVRISLKEYNDMRDRIRELENDNYTLTAERNEICDEYKVRQRIQTIRITEYTTNPHACGQKEIIEDRLVNMEDIKAELTEQWNEKQKQWQQKLDTANADKERLTKALDKCQDRKTNLEMEVYRLKSRTWWQRLFNK